MDKNTSFFKQARLLLRIIPYIAEESCFALKGGTALNFFIRDLPRLSVDIDLAYLPLESRDDSLNNIREALNRIKAKTSKNIGAIIVHEGPNSKLLFNSYGALVKLEVNEIMRGAVFPSKDCNLTKKAVDIFELSTKVQTLSFSDLYGGKICAALDRQHPRDFFDIKILMENEGMSDELRSSFVIYLACHNRPINELLAPNLLNMKTAFDNEFAGMTDKPVSYDELLQTRKNLIDNLVSSLTDNEKKFLLSVKEGKPDWNLMPIQGIDQLPALKWKVININRMSSKRHAEELNRLKKTLYPE